MTPAVVFASLLAITSPLFRPFTDPVSGEVSWELIPGTVGYNQQLLYFSQRSMTEDGRFLVITYAPDEKTGGVKDEGEKRLAVIDLEKNAVHRLPDIGRWSIGCLDTANAKYYTADRTDESMVVFDLRSAEPTKKIRLCTLPAEILALGPVKRWYTHLTLTADRTKAFLDISVNASRWIQGLLDLRTGAFERWGETTFPCGHAQISPVDDRVAYGGRSRPGWHRVPDTRKSAQPGATRLVQIPKGTPYPCMWLLRPGVEPVMVPSVEINHSTHQNWADDGSGWYYCSRLPDPARKHFYSKHGIYFHDLKADREIKLSGSHAVHAHFTRDMKKVVYDTSSWKGDHYEYSVICEDLATGAKRLLRSDMPPYLSREKSHLHPDPHPQFVASDRYVLSNVFLPDRQITVALFPVR